MKLIYNKTIFFIRNKVDNDFLFNILYHLLIFSVVMSIYSVYKISTIGNSIYFYLFFFILSLYTLIKYYKSCNQKNVLNRKYSLSTCILLGYLINNVLWEIMEKIMVIFYGKVSNLNQQILDNQVLKHPKMEVPLLFDGVLYAPIAEEIIFRALLLNVVLFVGYKLNIPNKKLIIIFLIVTSISFSSIHSSNSILTTLTFGLLGLNLGVIYIMSKSIVAPITVHLLNNLISSLDYSNNFRIQITFCILFIVVVLIEFFSKKENNFIKSIIKKYIV